MTLFEYLAVGASIILSSSVLRLLSGFQSASNREKGYWVVSVWIFAKIISHFNLWWGLWLFREGVEWTSFRFIAFLLPPLILYFQSTALIPSQPESVVSWRKHFYEAHGWFFGLNATLIIVTFLAFGFITGETTPRDYSGLFVIPIVLSLSIAGAIVSNPRFHAALTIIFVFLQFVQLWAFYEPSQSIGELR